MVKIRYPEQEAEKPCSQKIYRQDQKIHRL